jgi:hypothetical protein
VSILLVFYIFFTRHNRSNYFYLGLPQNGLKLLGDWAHCLYDVAVYLTDSKLQYPVVRYWHLYHTDAKAMQSDIMVRKFIKHSVYSSIGKATSLVPLLKLSSLVPVLTVYGTKVCFLIAFCYSLYQFKDCAFILTFGT